MLTHKGYVAKVTVDFEDGVLHGRVVGIRDVISFMGNTPAEVAEAFRSSVDDYLAFCAEQGTEPNRPYSGRLQVRFGPNLHRLLTEDAEVKGWSLNKLIRFRLARTVAKRSIEQTTEFVAMDVRLPTRSQLTPSIRSPRAKSKEPRVFREAKQGAKAKQRKVEDPSTSPAIVAVTDIRTGRAVELE